MKILIMEDPGLVPTILRLLRLVEDHTGERLEPVIALCKIEADYRLAECDMAIIYMDGHGDGTSILNRALNDMEIPVMATTIMTYKETYLSERSGLRFISKLDWEIGMFRKIMLEFIALAKKKADIIVLAA